MQYTLCLSSQFQAVNSNTISAETPPRNNTITQLFSYSLCRGIHLSFIGLVSRCRFAAKVTAPIHPLAITQVVALGSPGQGRRSLATGSCVASVPILRGVALECPVALTPVMGWVGRAVGYSDGRCYSESDVEPQKEILDSGGDLDSGFINRGLLKRGSCGLSIFMVGWWDWNS